MMSFKVSNWITPSAPASSLLNNRTMKTNRLTSSNIVQVVKDAGYTAEPVVKPGK